MDAALLATAITSNGYFPMAPPRPETEHLAPRSRRLHHPSRSRARNASLFLPRRVSVNQNAPLEEEEKIGEWHCEEEENKKRWIHFVGVGGSGISALAMLALKQGYEVSGSDLIWSCYMNNLQEAGARLCMGHSVLNVRRNKGFAKPDAVVISSAIPADSEEVAYAKSIGIPIYKRDTWLTKVTKGHNLIAVSGTHGKSTTAAMLSYVLKAMGDDLIAVIGANVPQFPGGNIIGGSGPTFVLEADEYDSCFLGISPYVAVVTNVEWEHVNIFKDEEAVRDIFRKFLNQIKSDGHLIICGDSAGACALLRDVEKETGSITEVMPTVCASNYDYNVTTYGTYTRNLWQASSIMPNLQGGQDYMLLYKDCPITTISIPLAGFHNVLNSLAVIATVASLVDDGKPAHDTIECVRYHLSKFKGVSRRFELIGKIHGCYIYDDYAHHPTEVRAVLQAARQQYPLSTIWVVFQPHTYSRLTALMKDFSAAFNDADYVLVTKVYAARETNDKSLTEKDLATSVIGPSAEYIPIMEGMMDKLLLEIPQHWNQEIIVLTLGAGDITTLGPNLLRRLRTIRGMNCSKGIGLEPTMKANWFSCTRGNLVMILES